MAGPAAPHRGVARNVPGQVDVLAPAVTWRRATIALALVVVGLTVALAMDAFHAREIWMFCKNRCSCHAK